VTWYRSRSPGASFPVSSGAPSGLRPGSEMNAPGRAFRRDGNTAPGNKIKKTGTQEPGIKLLPRCQVMAVDRRDGEGARLQWK